MNIKVAGAVFIIWFIGFIFTFAMAPIMSLGKQAMRSAFWFFYLPYCFVRQAMKMPDREQP